MTLILDHRAAEALAALDAERAQAAQRRNARQREAYQRRAQAALAAGRVPGTNGRPITRTDPRGTYMREWRRRRAQAQGGAR
jgi:hypothetical protein